MELAVDNDDVLIEILLRLPAKSLTRFKSVCKKWLSLISADYFCHLHTLRRPKLQLSLILKTHYCEFFYWNPTTYVEKIMIPYSVSVPVSDFSVAHACNGLMLLIFQQCDEPLRDGYYVYNPTTRRSRMISLTHNDEFPHVTNINLAFDPSNSPYYKIVCLKSTTVDPFDSIKGTCQIEVYDSQSQTWKVALQLTHPVPALYSYGRHWNNAIYWRYSNDFRCRCYCYFDIDKNEMKTLSFPQPLVAQEDTTAFSHHLLELNGHLYHIVCCRQVNDGEVDDDEMDSIKSRPVVIWELDHHSQWLLKHHYAFTSTAWVMSGFYTFYGLIGGSESDGDEICGILTYQSGKTGVYSFLDRSYRDFTSQPFYQPDLRERFPIRCFQFGETLALV